MAPVGQPGQPVQAGTVRSGSVGFGAKYITAAELSSNTGGTVPGQLRGGGTVQATSESKHNDSTMHMQGNDFADLKYFEPGEHRAANRSTAA